MNKKVNSGGNLHNRQALQGFGSHFRMLEPEVEHLIWLEESNLKDQSPSFLRKIFVNTWIQCWYASGFLIVNWNFWKAPKNPLMPILFFFLNNSLPTEQDLVYFFVLLSVLKRVNITSKTCLWFLCFLFHEGRLGTIKPLQCWSSQESYWALSTFTLSHSPCSKAQ